MKKIFKYLLISTACLSLGGCVDLLQEPKSFLTPENISYDKAKMATMADGLMKLLWIDNYGYNCRMQFLNIRADDVIAGNWNHADPRCISADELRFTATYYNKDVATLYFGFFALINNANIMVDGITADKTENDDAKNPFIAEARFMRAFAYFNLVRIFGEVPAITDSKCSKDILGNTTIGRNKVEDIYNLIIIPDLQFAEKNLSDAGRKNDNSTPSKDAAKLCLAEVYLTMAGWPLKLGQESYKLAADKAKEVIESNQKYKLLTDYGDLWREKKKSSREEHIFAINHSNLGGMASNYGTSYAWEPKFSGWQDYVADSVFFDNYPADKRRDWNYVSAFRAGNVIVPLKGSWRITKPRNPKVGEACLGIKKYMDFGTRTTPESVPNNLIAQSDGITPIYRYADALLIYAEAQNRADGGPNALAEKCINDIRKRAFRGIYTNAKYDKKNDANPENTIFPDNDGTFVSKPANGDIATGLSMEAFEKAVWDERGWEFFAEFKRWFELVRTERVALECGKNPRVKAAGNLTNPNVYYMPLPIEEVAINKWVNNPGY